MSAFLVTIISKKTSASHWVALLTQHKLLFSIWPAHGQVVLACGYLKPAVKFYFKASSRTQLVIYLQYEQFAIHIYKETADRRPHFKVSSLQRKSVCIKLKMREMQIVAFNHDQISKYILKATKHLCMQFHSFKVFRSCQLSHSKCAYSCQHVPYFRAYRFIFL